MEKAVLQNKGGNARKQISVFSEKSPLPEGPNLNFLIDSFKRFLSTSDFSHGNPYLELKARAKEIIRTRRFFNNDISSFIVELKNYRSGYAGNAINFKICANSFLSVLINEGPSLRGEPLVLPLGTLYSLAGAVTTREENLVLNSEHAYTSGELFLLGVPMRAALELGLKIRQN